MKKALFSVLLAGLTTCALSAQVDSSLTKTQITENVNLVTHTTSAGNYANITGFRTALNSTIFTQTSADDPSATTVTLAKYVTLDSIVLKGRSSTHQFAPSVGTLVKIAVYTDNNGTIGSFVGISSSTAYAYGSDKYMTYSFSGVELNSSSTYWYMFVNDSATEATLAADGLNVHSLRMGATAVTAADGSALTVTSPTADATLSTDNYFPSMTIKTSPIPEPATATLSLLALAGLAARRRRK